MGPELGGKIQAENPQPVRGSQGQGSSYATTMVGKSSRSHPGTVTQAYNPRTLGG